MSLTTVAVSVSANLITGLPMAGGTAHFELTGPDKDGSVIVPSSEDVTLDANGTGTANLWPNARGVNGTQYRVMLYDSANVLQFAGIATVPASACNLHDILALVPPAKVSDAQAAATAAQDYASQAQAVLVDAGFIAVKNDLPNIDAVAGDIANVNIVAGEVSQVNAVAGAIANVNAVGADVANINAVVGDLASIDTAAANIAAINGAAGNAAEAQAAAAAAAASAASVGATAIYQGMAQVLGLFAMNFASTPSANTQNFNSAYVSLMSIPGV